MLLPGADLACGGVRFRAVPGVGGGGNAGLPESAAYLGAGPAAAGGAVEKKAVARAGHAAEQGHAAGSAERAEFGGRVGPEVVAAIEVHHLSRLAVHRGDIAAEDLAGHAATEVAGGAAIAEIGPAGDGIGAVEGGAAVRDEPSVKAVPSRQRRGAEQAEVEGFRRHPCAEEVKAVGTVVNALAVEVVGGDSGGAGEADVRAGGGEAGVAAAGGVAIGTAAADLAEDAVQS